jgi:diguanylate cyclase (GGDEF)-like protein
MRGVEFPKIEGLTLQREIGRGALGVVYLARQGELEYAVKLQTSPTDLSLLKSGATLACLRHPGLPQIVEVGQIEGCSYLIREYIAGYTLAAELDEGPLQEARLVEIAKTLAGALQELHRHGLIHRDVKPSNVLLAKSGGVRLIDFGFATRLNGRAEGPAGTFLYSAPEQTGSLDLPLDQRADLYALGVLMYRALAGRHPFESDDPGELMRLHASVPAPPLQEATPALAAVVAKLLSKDPADRYQTGQSLLADLRALANLNERCQNQEELALGEQAPSLEVAYAPMVGREGEVAELFVVLEKVLQRSGKLVYLEGQPGSGKSLLVTEFLDRAARLCPLQLRCRTDQGKTPLGVVRAWMEDYFEFLRLQPPLARERWEQDLRLREQGLATYWAALSPAAADFFQVPAASDLMEVGDQVLDALRIFFTTIASLHCGAVLALDDVLAADDASLQVMRRLCLALEEAPILLLVAGRGPCPAGLSPLYLKLQLRPLGTAEVEMLVFQTLAGRPVSPELVNLISVRSQGNPFAICQFLKAMLEEAVLLPSREGWKLDAARLQNLQLPDTVLQLLVRRVQDLDDTFRHQLQLAALLGSQFTLEVLAAVLGLSEGPLRIQLQTGVQAQVLERRGQDSYGFVHDALREALLFGLAAEQRQQLHLSVAQGLEKVRAEHTFALAHHYGASRSREFSDRIYETSLEAGLLALRQVAFEEAYVFLQQAQQWRPQDLDWMEPLSLACEHTGRIEEAIQWLERLLEYHLEPVHRVQVLVRLTKLRQSKLNRANARDDCKKALQVIGLNIPDKPWWNAASALYHFGKLMWCEATGWGFGKLDRSLHERERTLAGLFQVYSEGEYFDMRYIKMLEMAARSCLCGFRLGPSPVTVSSYSNFQILFALLRKRSWLDRWSARVEKIADQLGDPISKSYFEVTRQVALHIMGLVEDIDSRLDKLLAQRAHLLDPYALMVGIADLAWSLLMRGQVRQAYAWVLQGMQRCQMTSSPAGISRDQDILACYAISCLAILGQAGEALVYVDRLKDRCHSPATDRSLRANYFAHLLALQLESRDLGAPLEQTGQAFLELGLSPKLAPLHRRHFYVFWAYAWLERCYRSEAKPSDREQLQEALKLLKITSNRPVLKCHHQIAQAGWLYLQGQLEESLHALAAAAHLADLLEAPWPSYEIARLRARALAGLGKYESAAREGERAYRLALELGWSARAKAVARELSLARPSGSTGSTSREITSLKATPDETLRIRLERQLDSLLHLSLASSQLSNPYDQTRLVLDELVRLLNAERAYVFLLNHQELKYFTGRDQQNNTLDAPEKYSRTVIERVQQERQPLIIAGTEEGEVLGSRSVIDHNLRSIICAPLTLGDEFVGLIYLDSRLARGVFSEDDVSLVNALSHHIAVGIEASRAARLEMEVESERRQRALADVLSEFTMSLSSTLEPERIVDHLLETLLRAITFVRAAVWLGPPEKLRLIASRGYPESVRPGRSIVAGEERGFDRAVQWKRPAHEACQGHEPGLPQVELKGQFSWLAIPLLSEQQVAGVVTLSADRLDAFGESEVDVAFTFCNQAGIALANAHLFKEINRLATTDALTGCYNRRRFFQIAERELERCRREHIPFCLLMTDIDFFKKFNDTYGHACGDEVLVTVSKILRENLGEIGTLGRFGGEEFAMCLAGFEEVAGRAVAEKLRLAVEAERLWFEGKALQVTLSLGLACLSDGENLESLLARADGKLYEAKGAGRNRVC